MKLTYIKTLAVLFAGAVISFSLVACGDEGTEGGGNTDNTELPDNDNLVGDSDDLTPEQNKEKLEAVANQFLSFVKASDFQDVRDLANDLNNLYSDVEASDELETWWDKTLDNITTYISGDAYYTEYQRLYSASQVKGHFTVSNGQWIRTEANDLQVSVVDSKGRNCVVSLTTSGSTKRVFVGESEGDDGYDPYNYTYYYNYYDNYVDIPQTINFVVTAGSEQLVNVTVTTDLSQVDEEIDITRNSFSATVNAKVKGYNINVSRAIYKAQGQAAVTFTLSKDNTKLLSVAVDGTSKISGSADNPDVTSASIANLNVDVLGQVQVKGALDVYSLVNALEAVDEYDESATKRAANNATALLRNVAVYYDGGSNKRAGVEMEAYRDNYFYDSYYWDVRPVISFSDGTKYAFEEYFTDSRFNSVINTVEQIERDFRNLIDGINQ